MNIPERAYNILSWWFIIWIFLYISNITPINPFIAIVTTIIFDIYGAYMLNTKQFEHKSMDKLLVNHFRLICVILAHWIPLITLPPKIDYQSIGLLVTLVILYIGFLFLQGLTPNDVYNVSHLNSANINSLEQFFILRFHSFPIGFIGYGLLFYTGIQLLMHPAKSSYLHKLY